MKKLFIGLLIIAAGAGIFFFLQEKKNKEALTIQKELLTGKWKLDSIDVKTKDSSDNFIALITSFDSNFIKYRYDFLKEGTILRSLKDSVTADTSFYSWNKKNELLWKESAKDSTSEVFTVSKLNPDSLVLLSKDSASFVFTRPK